MTHVRRPVWLGTVLCLMAVGPRAARADPGPLAEALDALYARREDPHTAAALTAQLNAAAPADRDDFQVLWRAARFKVWLGDLATDAAAKRTLGTEAAALARRAIARESRRVEGYYYAALGVGIYCQAVGVLKILREGRDREFTQELDRALAIDATFANGGPWLVKGRYFFELPWPMRDVGKSIDYYQRVLARFHFCPRARLYLAEALLKDGRAAAADSQLAHLFDGDQGQDPPESRRVRALAVEVRARVDKELHR